MIDVGLQNTLLEAGLVDSSGSFTSEPNFGGPSESGLPDREPQAPQRREERDDDYDPFAEPKPGTSPKPEEPEAQPQPNQEPAKQPQVLPTPSAPSGRPDSGDLGPQNPDRLGGQDDPVRQKYDSTLSQLQQTAQMAFLRGQTLTNEQGERLYSDEELAQRIGGEYQYFAQQAFLGSVMEKMQPVAKRAAAEEIAKEYGVEVGDIINEGSPVEMRTRAKTIADLVRDGRFVARKEAGTDAAEGSRSYNNSIPEALNNLSPQQKMYVGFARGDY